MDEIDYKLMRNLLVSAIRARDYNLANAVWMDISEHWGEDRAVEAANYYRDVLPSPTYVAGVPIPVSRGRQC